MIPRRWDGGYARVGHRGAARLAAENTIAALEAAFAIGVDAVEVDVVRASGRLVLAHSLADLTPESPTLDETLAFLAAESPGEVWLDLDLKGIGFEDDVVRSLHAHGLAARTLVSSFFPEVLRAVRRLDPSLPTGLAYPRDRVGATTRRVPDRVVLAALAALRRALPARIAPMLRRAHTDAAMLHHLVVSAPLVARCHALGVPVFAWTVNDERALARVVSLGVHGVISDDPRLFAARR